MNAIMSEYTACLGIARRYGTPWRPMEQGLVENKHKETQKVLGMLVRDVMQCFPNEFGELHHVVEYIVYNTPAAHGLTPRDIDRQWSTRTPLLRELTAFEVGELEPVSEYVKRIFASYKDIKQHVLNHLFAEKEKRALNANKHRYAKPFVEGDVVVLRDPKHKKAGGRTAGKQPSSEKCQIVEVRGNRLTVKQADGTLLKDVHTENALLVPPGAQNFEDFEGDPLFEEELDLPAESAERRRSPGMMLEDHGKSVREAEQALGPRPAKLTGLAGGVTIAYQSFPSHPPADHKGRTCSVGKVLEVSRIEQEVIVHQYAPTKDAHLLLKWEPLYVEQGTLVFGSGSHPSTEKVARKSVLEIVQLHSGVMSHAAMRRIESRGFEFDIALARRMMHSSEVQNEGAPEVSEDPGPDADLDAGESGAAKGGTTPDGAQRNRRRPQKGAWKDKIKEVSYFLRSIGHAEWVPEFHARCRKVHLLHLSRRESNLAANAAAEHDLEAENFASGCTWTPGWAWNWNDEGHCRLLRQMVEQHMCPSTLLIEEMPEKVMPSRLQKEVMHLQSQGERRFVYVGFEDRAKATGALEFFADRGCWVRRTYDCVAGISPAEWSKSPRIWISNFPFQFAEKECNAFRTCGLRANELGGAYSSGLECARRWRGGALRWSHSHSQRGPAGAMPMEREVLPNRIAAMIQAELAVDEPGERVELSERPEGAELPTPKVAALSRSTSALPWTQYRMLGLEPGGACRDLD